MFQRHNAKRTLSTRPGWSRERPRPSKRLHLGHRNRGAKISEKRKHHTTCWGAIACTCLTGLACNRPGFNGGYGWGMCCAAGFLLAPWDGTRSKAGQVVSQSTTCDTFSRCNFRSNGHAQHFDRLWWKLARHRPDSCANAGEHLGFNSALAVWRSIGGVARKTVRSEGRLIICCEPVAQDSEFDEH